MGEMIVVTCDGCGLHEQHSVGIGMMGVAHRLCVCPSCRSFREQSWNELEHEPAPPLVCSSCASPVIEVTADRLDRPRRGRLAKLIAQATEDQGRDGAEHPPFTDRAHGAPCPRCGHGLEVQLYGVWD